MNSAPVHRERRRFLFGDGALSLYILCIYFYARVHRFRVVCIRMCVYVYCVLCTPVTCPFLYSSDLRVCTRDLCTVKMIQLRTTKNRAGRQWCS